MTPEVSICNIPVELYRTAHFFLFFFLDTERRRKTHVGAAPAKDQAQHSRNGKPLRNGFDEYPAGETHEFGQGGSLIVNTVQFGLL